MEKCILEFQIATPLFMGRLKRNNKNTFKTPLPITTYDEQDILVWSEIICHNLGYPSFFLNKRWIHYIESMYSWEPAQLSNIWPCALFFFLVRHLFHTQHLIDFLRKIKLVYNFLLSIIKSKGQLFQSTCDCSTDFKKIP